MEYGTIPQLAARIQSRRETYRALSDQIWDCPETAFHETTAAALLQDFLQGQGFAIEPNLGGLATAFSASWGSGGPVIALLGEYDALPGLSQASNCPFRRAVYPGGAGHGCGHNLLGVGAAAAAVAVKETLEASSLPGTIRFYGCPAEESGCGKGILAEAGAFAGVDACLTWHPADCSQVVSAPYLANVMLSARFRGLAAHAASAPELGRSALDACELMNVGANYLREHVPADTRFHYAYTNHGGDSPNTVQETAELLYYVRSPRIADARATAARLKQVARGAALMTETRLTFRTTCEMFDYLPNHTLGRVMDQILCQTGAPAFTEGEQSAAAPFCTLAGTPLSTERLPYSPGAPCLSVSSDVGNVSHLIPTAQLYTACFTRGTPFHSWQLVSQLKQPPAHRGRDQAALVLACTALRLMEQPTLLQEARRELEQRDV